MSVSPTLTHGIGCFSPVWCCLIYANDALRMSMPSWLIQPTPLTFDDVSTFGTVATNGMMADWSMRKSFNWPYRIFCLVGSTSTLNALTSCVYCSLTRPVFGAVG